MRDKFLLLRGDSLVLDRWNWLKKHLPKTKEKINLLDVGCGNGSFSIGLAKRGYACLGLTWDEKDKKSASQMVKSLDLKNCLFDVQDVRFLDKRKDLKKRFYIAICTENIEHIINDKKLMKDISGCLLPGGKLLLTTPNDSYIPIGKGDAGPFKKIEDGNHVRKGYTEKRLKELCKASKMTCEEISYCGGFISQKITGLYRLIGKFNKKLAWCIILPLKIFPILFDNPLTKYLKWPQYSICMVATKKE